MQTKISKKKIKIDDSKSNIYKYIPLGEKKEPENLLILTRTTTDRHGRRHSVAVPLIPPPDGEKFEGGYSVERNPITGGAKLVPPTGGKPPYHFSF